MAHDAAIANGVFKGLLGAMMSKYIILWIERLRVELLGSPVRLNIGNKLTVFHRRIVFLEVLHKTYTFCLLRVPDTLETINADFAEHDGQER